MISIRKVRRSVLAPPLPLALALCAAVPVPAAAATKGIGGEARVRAMLSTSPVVRAAVAEARRFSGAKACATRVKATQPPEFEPDTTFDYQATITCTANESSGIVEVRGRMFGDGPQALTLKLDYAG